MDRQLKKKKWPPKKIATVGGISVFVILVLYMFIFGDKSSKLNVEVDKITISTVARGEFQEFIPIIGNVMPKITHYLDAEEGGRVETKYIEAGTMVKAGDPILKLENTDLVLDIMWRESDLMNLINNLRSTRLSMEQNRLNLKQQLTDLNNQIANQKRLYERNQELWRQGLISMEEFETSRDQYNYLFSRTELTKESARQDSLFRAMQVEQLENSVRRMENNLLISKQKQENLVLRAPITGQLTSLNAEIGESKTRGQRLGQIDVLEGYKVRAAIDEHYLARIEIGRTGTFPFAGKDNKLVVTKTFPEVQDGRFEVDMEFVDAEPTGIRRGQTCHIRLELGDLTEAILLSTGGFYQKTGGQWVYVLDPSESFAIKRRIRINRGNTQVYEVLEGLEPGEKVITSSYDSFGDIDKLILKK